MWDYTIEPSRVAGRVARSSRGVVGINQLGQPSILIQRLPSDLGQIFRYTVVVRRAARNCSLGQANAEIVVWFSVKIRACMHAVGWDALMHAAC